MKLSTADLKMIIDGFDARFLEYYVLSDIAYDTDIMNLVSRKIDKVKRAREFFEYKLGRCKHDMANISLQPDQLDMAVEAVKARIRKYDKILGNVKHDTELTRIVQEYKSKTMELNTMLLREINRLSQRSGTERIDI